MNTLPIRKPIDLDTGFFAPLAALFSAWAARFSAWRLSTEQRDLEAYLGASQNMADLDRRLRDAQYTDRQSFF